MILYIVEGIEGHEALNSEAFKRAKEEALYFLFPRFAVLPW
jgi:hypothetical protein